MARRPGSFWQDRVLQRERMFTIRVKLIWTLTILLLLSLIPVAGALFTLHRTRTEITSILRTGIDPSLMVDDVQLGLAQSRLARFDFLFAGEAGRGRDAVASASFVRFVIENGKELWPYSGKELEELQVLARRYEDATRALVQEEGDGEAHPRLVISDPAKAEEARRLFQNLRDEATRATDEADRERALRLARQALLDLDDVVDLRLDDGGEADSLLQVVNRTEGRLEDLFHGVYTEATRSLTQERHQVARNLSLSVRDLLAIIVVAVVLALVVATTAPRWILRPIRRLTGLIHYARTGQPPEEGLPVSEDEVGRLTLVLEEHLRRDRDVEDLRRTLHRASVQRLEALLDAEGLLAAGVAPGGHLAFAGRRLRDALGMGGPTSMAIPFEQFWPDPELNQAVRAFRTGSDAGADGGTEVVLTLAPFQGRRARLVRTRAGDPSQAEILVLLNQVAGPEEVAARKSGQS